MSARRSRACSGLEAAGLMFQQRNAWISAGSSSRAASSIWLKRRRALAQRGARQVVAVHALPPAAVEVEHAGAGLAEVAGDRRQQRAGTHHVAAHRLALQPLAEPEQRRALHP